MFVLMIKNNDSLPPTQHHYNCYEIMQENPSPTPATRATLRGDYEIDDAERNKLFDLPTSYNIIGMFVFL